MTVFPPKHPRSYLLDGVGRVFSQVYPQAVDKPVDKLLNSLQK
jgi:hypothetical protein